MTVTELRGLDWASRSVRSRARRIDTAQQQRTPGPADLILHRERIGYLHQAVEAPPSASTPSSPATSSRSAR